MTETTDEAEEPMMEASEEVAQPPKPTFSGRRFGWAARSKKPSGIESEAQEIEVASEEKAVLEAVEAPIEKEIDEARQDPREVAAEETEGGDHEKLPVLVDSRKPEAEELEVASVESLEGEEASGQTSSPDRDLAEQKQEKEQEQERDGLGAADDHERRSVVEALETENALLKEQALKSERNEEKIKALHEALVELRERERHDVGELESRLTEKVAHLQRQVDARDERLRLRRERAVRFLRVAKEGLSSVEALRGELDAAREHRVRVVTELAELKGQGGQLDSLRLEIEELTGRAVSAETERERVQEEAERAQRAQADLREREREIEAMRQRLDALETESQIASEERERLAGELGSATQHGEAQETTIEEQKSAISDLRDALADARQEKLKAVKAESTNAQALITRDRELEALKTELDRVRVDKREVEAELAHLAEEVQEHLGDGEGSGDSPGPPQSGGGGHVSRIAQSVRQMDRQLSSERARTASLEGQLDAMRSEKENVLAAIAERERELELPEDVVRRHEAEMKEREQQVDTLQNELAGFTSLLQERESEHASLERHLEEVREGSREREATLKRALAEAGKSKEQLQARLEDMRGTLHEVSKELEAKKRREETLEKRLSLVHDEVGVDRLTKEASDAKEAAQNLRQTLETREKQLEELQAQCRRLESGEGERAKLEFTKLENEHQRLSVALEARDEEMRRSEELLNQTRKELRTLQRSSEERTREFAVLQRDCDDRRERESRALAKVRRLEKELESFKIQLAEKERGLRDLKSMVDRQRDRASQRDDELLQQVRHLEAALKERERDLKEREAKMRRLQEDVESLQTDLRVNSAKYEHRTETLEQKQATTANAAQSRIAQAEAVAQQWMQRSAALEKNVEALRRQALGTPGPEVQASVDELRRQLKESQDEADAARRKITWLDYEKRQLESKLEINLDARPLATDREEKIAKVRDDLGRIKGLIRSKDRQIEALSQQLAQLTTDQR